MKKLICSIFILPVLLVSTSTFSKSAKTPGAIDQKKNWAKSVWSIIERDQKVNNPIFEPSNEHVPGFYEGTGRMNLAHFESEKESVKWNLWTIIVYHFIKNDLDLYLPFNPDWEIQTDNGHLLYPFTAKRFGNSEDGNFQTDEKFREDAHNYGILGTMHVDPFAAPLKSKIYPDEDSINAEGYAIYPPSTFVPFSDKDIIKYKIKEDWIVDKNGMVKDKEITAIAPIINMIDHNGQIVGEREIFWLDFNQLATVLSPYFVMMDRYRTERVVSFAKFFKEREFYADFLSEEKTHVSETK